MKKSLKSKINGSKKTAKIPILYPLKFQGFQRLRIKMNAKDHAKKPLSGALMRMRKNEGLSPFRATKSQKLPVF